MKISYLNHAYDQLDEESTPMLRGALNIGEDQQMYGEGRVMRMVQIWNRKRQNMQALYAFGFTVLDYCDIIYKNGSKGERKTWCSTLPTRILDMKTY